MASLTIDLPDVLNDWLKGRAEERGYGDPVEYLKELIARDRGDDVRELSLDEIRALVEDSRLSGIGSRSMREIFEDAASAVRVRARASG